MADPVTFIAVTAGLASLGSSLYTLVKKRLKNVDEPVTLLIRKQDGSEIRIDNVPRTAVAEFERQAQEVSKP